MTTLPSLGPLAGDLKEPVESRSAQAALDPWMEGLEWFTLGVPRASLGREPGPPAPPWEFTGRKGDRPLLPEAGWGLGRGQQQIHVEVSGVGWGSLAPSPPNPHTRPLAISFHQPLSHYPFLQRAVSELSVHHLLWIKLSPLRFRGEALSPIAKSFRR